MDKQKQMIKQLRKDLCNGYCGYETCGDCYGENDSYIGCTGMAERLYDVGYRKIPENAVVLTQSEKQKLLHEMYEQGSFDALADLSKEGKVVLTVEEYKKLESLARDKCHYDCDLIDYPDFEIEKKLRDNVRKETAVKFAGMAKERKIEMGTDGHSYCMVFEDDIDEIAKKFMEGKV